MAKPDVSGTSVSNATSVEGGSGDIMDPIPGLADDIATINANTANRYPVGTGTRTSVGRRYGVGAGGQTDGGY